ncbi:type IV secretory pathway VirB2 component (pilin) [Pseudomonas sp. TE3786]|jgi:type IV secretory pathway VirB2 component (pilin)
MNQLKTNLQNNASTFRAKASHLALVAGVSVAMAGNAMAAVIPVVDVDEVKAQISQGGTDAGSIGTTIAIVLAVLACAGVVFGMLRKS